MAQTSLASMGECGSVTVDGSGKGRQTCAVGKEQSTESDRTGPVLAFSNISEIFRESNV